MARYTLGLTRAAAFAGGVGNGSAALASAPDAATADSILLSMPAPLARPRPARPPPGVPDRPRRTDPAAAPGRQAAGICAIQLGQEALTVDRRRSQPGGSATAIQQWLDDRTQGAGWPGRRRIKLGDILGAAIAYQDAIAPEQLTPSASWPGNVRPPACCQRQLNSPRQSLTIALAMFAVTACGGRKSSPSERRALLPLGVAGRSLGLARSPEDYSRGGDAAQKLERSLSKSRRETAWPSKPGSAWPNVTTRRKSASGRQNSAGFRITPNNPLAPEALLRAGDAFADLGTGPSWIPPTGRVRWRRTRN
jgi:hypothetical protein